MRWSWHKKSSLDRLVFSWSGGVFAYVRALASPNTGGLAQFTIQQMGVLHQGDRVFDDFILELRGLGLKGLIAHGMLRLDQYQLLQIDSPPVAPEEVRSAARYQIKDMVHAHLDDITLDVMKVGDGQQKGTGNLFVVATLNEVVRGLNTLGDALNWEIPVIDIHETAQRNLQTLVALAENHLDKAEAALLLSDERQITFTITANEELFLSRRLELPAGFWQALSGGAEWDMTDAERAQRFVLEVQRSMDLWDRTWSHRPLGGLRVYAGEHSAAFATWLGHEIGQVVGTMDFHPYFTGLDSYPIPDQTQCLPLLGVLLRTETRKL